MKNISLISATLNTVVMLGFASHASAALVDYSFDYTPTMLIGDNDGKGVWDTKSINIRGATSLSSIQVRLNIDCEYNGDYYAYLRHGTTGFAVLLNRVGVTSSGSSGYADSGFNVQFSDSPDYVNIHNYQSVFDPKGGSLTGTWQPDGRNVDPSSTDLTDRTAMLASFHNMDPNGDWTLFVADASPLGVGTLRGWGITMTVDVAAVPEPASGVAAIAMVALLCLLKREQNCRI
jgi:subtilisin-like proprotein convertase family protein